MQSEIEGTIKTLKFSTSIWAKSIIAAEVYFVDNNLNLTQAAGLKPDPDP